MTRLLYPLNLRDEFYRDYLPHSEVPMTPVKSNLYTGHDGFGAVETDVSRSRVHHVAVQRTRSRFVKNFTLGSILLDPLARVDRVFSYLVKDPDGTQRVFYAAKYTYWVTRFLGNVVDTAYLRNLLDSANELGTLDYGTFLPDLSGKIQCPFGCTSSQFTTAADCVVHLNDNHRMPRQRIAWHLKQEGLDFTIPEPHDITEFVLENKNVYTQHARCKAGCRCETAGC